ncbi:MAG: trehalose-6-phosphate synthase [Acidobacteriota bacterium]
MKITVRLIISLVLVATFTASIFAFLQVRKEQARLASELEQQAMILAESLQESVKDLVRSDSPTKLKLTVERFGNREELLGVAVYDDKGKVLGTAPGLLPQSQQATLQLAESIIAAEMSKASVVNNRPLAIFETMENNTAYIQIVPLQKDSLVVGALGLFYDASHIEELRVSRESVNKPRSRLERANLERINRERERERERFQDQLERRAKILAEGLTIPVRELFWSDAPIKLKSIVERFSNRERLVGVAIYDNKDVILASTPGLLSQIEQLTPQLTRSAIVTESVTESIREKQGTVRFETIDNKEAHVYTIPLEKNGKVVGALAVFHDASYIGLRLKEIWHNNFLRLLTQSLLIILTTMIVVRWSITGPIAQIAEWLKGMRTGQLEASINLPRGGILTPLTTEVAHLAKTLATARAMAEEAQLRIKTDSLWTAERLKEHMRVELEGRRLFVVSNREPYIHVKKGQEIECMIPAGGLVAALDPVLRACGGVWIAHGSGSADRETSDQQGRLQVPPSEPLYTLKRVWISKEEEEGYYYGFSNEGIWPLCHITHTRPTFRLQDWICYQQINEKFAQALLDEVSLEKSPLILIQDYHLALVPLLIKAHRPDARIAIFWHIPWPNAEVFGICPWKEELLLGLLGADLIGFQTQFHCNNFLETVDRFLESKINWELFSVARTGRTTVVKPFPISVAFPDTIQLEKSDNPASIFAELLAELGVKTKYLGVGVDRLDYTKGIIERFQAIERFLEKYPEFIGKFTFVELGAPSRTHIKRYHDLIAEIETTVDKINWRFQTEEWKPIIFLKAHHNHDRINRYYKAAAVCMVTSLHDGMNLVAKEYIAARTDEDGVLILSQFTGAAQELPDALIVNPYDIEEMAEAIRNALMMRQVERVKRMQKLREVVSSQNVYRWAASLVITLSQLRISKPLKEVSFN